MYLPEEFQFDTMLELKQFIAKTQLPTDQVINIHKYADRYVLFAWIKHQ